MVRRIRKRKCKNCKEFFLPDYRNLRHQHHCSKPECRKASKRESQRRWLAKPENVDHFRGPENVARVQAWRKAHGGYWRKPPLGSIALQDDCDQKSNAAQAVSGTLVESALQDLLHLQPPVFIGLISTLTGSALQEDIENSIKAWHQYGIDILCGTHPRKGERHDDKTPYSPGKTPQSSLKVQLGGSPSGP